MYINSLYITIYILVNICAILTNELYYKIALKYEGGKFPSYGSKDYEIKQELND